MNKFIAGVVVAALAYFGYTTWQKRQEKTPVPTAQRESAPASPAAAASSPVAPDATPAPVRKNLAPTGVFYLTQRVSVTSTDGIIGIPPGTRVTKVGDVNGDMRVTDGHHEFVVSASGVTNDMDAGRVLRENSQKQWQASARSVQQSYTGNASQQPSRPSTTPSNYPAHIPGVAKQSTGLDSSTGVGATHTRTKGGYLWQKTPDGKYWITVKRLDGGYMGPPMREPAH